MNIRLHASSILTLIMVCLISPSALAQPERKRVRPDAPALAVRSFYKFHFTHDQGFLKPNVELRKSWLTPELYKLLMNEFSRYDEHLKTHPDDAPYMEGDPFTNSVEETDAYIVGISTVQRDGRAIVPVRFLSQGRLHHTIKVELMRSADTWLICNLHYDRKEADLLTQLRRPEYDSEVKLPGE